MQNKRYVVGLGEVLWDVLPKGKKLGGAPANSAYHAGQFLGSDNTIAISALGEDKLADETIEALREHNLNDLLPRVPYPTGTVQVQLDEQGIPTYDIKENVAWDNIPFDDDIKQIAQNCRAVCFGSLAQRNVVSRETIHKFLDATPADCVKIFDKRHGELEKGVGACNEIHSSGLHFRFVKAVGQRHREGARFGRYYNG